jgi:hypothetical protein
MTEPKRMERDATVSTSDRGTRTLMGTAIEDRDLDSDVELRASRTTRAGVW